MQFIIVRWFHNLVWALLAISFFMRATENSTLVGLADPISMTGGIVYVIYITTFARAMRR